MLYLYNNQISILQVPGGGIFGNDLIALYILRLENNKIKDIQPNTFVNLTALIELNLEGNQLNNFEEFPSEYYGLSEHIVIHI